MKIEKPELILTQTEISPYDFEDKEIYAIINRLSELIRICANENELNEIESTIIMSNDNSIIK